MVLAIEGKPTDKETAAVIKNIINPTINGEPQFSLTYDWSLNVMLLKPILFMYRGTDMFKIEASNLTFAHIEGNFQGFFF